MIEKALRDKIARLIAEADRFENVAEIRRNNEWLANVDAWITSVLNTIKMALPDLGQAYRQRIEMAAMPFDTASQRLLIIRSTLRGLLIDVDEGLVGTIADKIRAETFESFLDQAEAHRDRAKDFAGVIASVMFEDTLRRMYANRIDKFQRPDLEQVIIALEQKQVITQEQGRQARVAQLVRNKALHADWANFTRGGIDDTIKITKALIEEHLK